MSTVGARESVVDIDVDVFRQFGGEFGIVLFFFGIETQVFQHDDIAVFHRFDRGFDFRSDAVVNENDFLTQSFFNVGNDLSQRHFRNNLTFGTAEVRSDDDFRAFVRQSFDGRDETVDTGGVGDFAVFERDVQIGADENDFAFGVQIFNRIEFSHFLFSSADKRKRLPPLREEAASR